MSKQTATTKSAAASAKAPAAIREKKPRPAKIAQPANADFWQGYNEWQPV